MISGPQEGESYEVSGEISEKVHEELAKRSGGSLNAYMGNVLEYDKSRKFVQEYAIKAAAQANSMCKSKRDFPELFQLSYQWVYDTGASNHFVGNEQPRVPKHTFITLVHRM